MIVLGLDPGFANFGWCLVRVSGHSPDSIKVLDMGVIKTRKDTRKVLVAEDNFKRAVKLTEELSTILFEREPQVMCAESMSYPPHASTAAKMSISWGVVAALSCMARLPVVQRSPQEIKMAITGSQKASKHTMAATLGQRYPEGKEALRKLPQSLHEHPWDALGAVVASMDSEVIKMGLR